MSILIIFILLIIIVVAVVFIWNKKEGYDSIIDYMNRGKTSRPGPSPTYHKMGIDPKHRLKPPTPTPTPKPKPKQQPKNLDPDTLRRWCAVYGCPDNDDIQIIPSGNGPIHRVNRIGVCPKMSPDCLKKKM